MSRFAKAFVLFVSLIGLGAWGGNANAAICTTNAGAGLWGAVGTWDCGHVPVAADSVVISRNITAVATTVTGLTVNPGITLTDGGFTVTITGNLTNNGIITGGGNMNVTGAASVISGNGTYTNSCLYTSGAAPTVAAGAVLNFTGSSRIYTGRTQAGTTVAGSVLTINGTINSTVATATTTFLRLYANSTIIGSTGVISASVSTTSYYNATATLTNNGSVTVATVTGNSATGSIWTNAANSTLNVSAAFLTTGTLNASAAGNTVNYSGAVAQTVKATTYSNLTLSGTLAKTITTATTIVNGILSMEGTATASAAPTYGAAATLQYNTATARIAGVEWITPFAATGGVIIANTGVITLNAAKVFNASVPLTINSGATLATGNFGLTFGGDFVNNGGTFTAGSSPIVIANTMAAQSIDGFTTTGAVSMTKTGGTATLQGNVNGGALTINGIGGTLDLGAGLTHTFTGAWTRTNGTLNGGSSTLNVGGSCSGAGGTFTAGTGTVNWNAAGAQTVCQYAYNNLTLSNSGAKTMTGVTAIAGDLSITGAATMTGNAAFTAGGALNYSSTGATTLAAPIVIGSYNQTAGTFSAGANAITVSGNWNETGTFNPGTGTVTLSGATAQTISGTSPVNFNNLTVTNGANPNITLATNVTVAGTLTGTVNLTATCPTDYTLTAGATVYHSCPPVTPPANFDCVETGLTYPAARNPLYTKLAGSAFSFDVVALKADGTVETTYASTGNKTVTVELVDGTGATACASRTALTPPVSQTLTFTAANLGRKTAASMTVSKAYANLRCRVTDATGIPTIVGCSADNFSVRPASLALTAATGLLDADTLNGASTTNPPKVKAGANFTLTATASDTGYTGTPTIDLTALAAHSGAVRAGTLTGTFAAAASGVVSSTFTYDEVGYFMLNANGLLDATFTAVDNAVGDCTADFSTTLSTPAPGKYGCKIGSAAAGYFGRFIPDHFDVTVNSNGTIAAACVSGGFTYTGQAMGYGTVPSLTIKPINAATGSTVTQNYSGSFQKLTAANVTIAAPTADGTQNGLDGLTKTVLAASMSAGTLTNTSGTLTYTLAAGDQYTYTRDANSLVGAYTSNIPLVVASVSDGEISSAGTLPTLSPTGVSLRFGRLKLSNAHGSELLNLPIPIQAQYWNGTAFVTNAADNCTALATNNIKFTTTLTGVSATVGGAFSSGVGSLTLTKPTPAAKGAVDVCVDLDSGVGGDTTCQATTPAAKLYLQTGTAYNKDPTARATFGVYKGNNEFIYLRENY